MAAKSCQLFVLGLMTTQDPHILVFQNIICDESGDLTPAHLKNLRSRVLVNPGQSTTQVVVLKTLKPAASGKVVLYACSEQREDIPAVADIRRAVDSFVESLDKLRQFEVVTVFADGSTFPELLDATHAGEEDYAVYMRSALLGHALALQNSNIELEHVEQVDC